MIKIRFSFVHTFYFWGMKQLLAIPLIFIMLGKPLWPVVEYVINYDYIVTHLCENSDRPQLECDGKCYLAKMFAEKSTDHQENPFSKGQSIEIPLLFHLDTTKYTLSEQWLDVAKRTVNPRPIFHDFFFVFEIIQPPEMA